MIRAYGGIFILCFLLSLASVSHAEDFLRAKLWGTAIDSFVPDSGFITSFKAHQNGDWNVLYAFNEFGDSGAVFQTRLWGTGVQEFLPTDYIDSLKCIQNGDSAILLAHSLDNTEGRIVLSRITGLGFQTAGATPGSAIREILKSGPDSEGYCYLTISTSPVGIGDDADELPSLLRYPDLKVSPNPFSEYCALTYTIPKSAFVSLTIYDCSGRIMALPVSARKSRGVHATHLDGSVLSPGIYFVKLKVGECKKTQKILLIK